MPVRAASVKVGAAPRSTSISAASSPPSCVAADASTSAATRITAAGVASSARTVASVRGASALRSVSAASNPWSSATVIVSISAATPSTVARVASPARSGVCEGGTCFAVHVDIGCVLPTVMCGGGCVDLSTDPNNCGACGTVCPDGVCEGGTCAPVQVVLAASYPWSSASTVADLSSDPNNCGACGTVCADGSLCRGRSVLGHRPRLRRPPVKCAAYVSTSAATRTTVARVAPSAGRRLRGWNLPLVHVDIGCVLPTSCASVCVPTSAATEQLWRLWHGLPGWCVRAGRVPS